VMYILLKNVCCRIYVCMLFIFLLVVLHTDEVSVDRFSESAVSTHSALLHYC
jgi:hypothetical protein